MARYVVRVRTARSAPDAFAYMAHLTNFAEWDPGVVRAEQAVGSGPGPDAEYDVAVKGWFGRTLTLRYRTEAYDAPRRVLVRAASKVLTSIDEITVEGADGGAIVTYDARLELGGVLRLGDPMLGLAFRRIGDRAAAGLIAALDGERVASAAAER
jgi:hypothetical protein